jgi:hypothetical protein
LWSKDSPLFLFTDISLNNPLAYLMLSWFLLLREQNWHSSLPTAHILSIIYRNCHLSMILSVMRRAWFCF